MTTTDLYYLRLLDAVVAAGDDPHLAYVVRTRLRRALLAVERGRNTEDGARARPLNDAPAEVPALVADLRARVHVLCQPSEALNARWVNGWADVRTRIETLRGCLERRAPS